MAERLSPETLDELSERGMAIYRDRLREILEPTYNGQIVVIHPDTGEYAVAPTSSAAVNALRQRIPTGLVVITDVGLVPDDDLLTLRMERGRLVGEAIK